MKRNPNNYGSVTKLSGKRSRPYVARITAYDSEGFSYRKILGYTETRSDALQLLAQYHDTPWSLNRDQITFSQLFELWSDTKAQQLGASSVKRINAAYNWCKYCYGMKYREIRSYHMQRCIDECSKSRETKASIRNLFHHLDEFAYESDIIGKMYSPLVTVRDEVKETSRTPFTESQVKDLWCHASDPDVQIVLIYIYTGFRLNELLQMKKEQVDLTEKTFTGGLKTTMGKNRVVPIHHKIIPFIEHLMESPGDYLLGERYSEYKYYKRWKAAMALINADKTPHEARHTFETELDNAGANRRCIDLLMGHKSVDVGNRVYNHKTMDQLRDAIEKLK